MEINICLQIKICTNFTIFTFIISVSLFGPEQSGVFHPFSPFLSLMEFTGTLQNARDLDRKPEGM